MPGHTDPKERKRNQIVAGASRAFARSGFAGTTMAAIAAEAGVGKGTLYEYFPSKEDLFFAVFRWFSERTGAAARVRIAALQGPAADRIRAVGAAVMAAWPELREVFALFMEFWSAAAASQMQPRFKEAFRETYAEFRGIVAALLQEGVQRGEFRDDIDTAAIAAALVGTWDALLLQAWFEADFDPAVPAATFVDVLLAGLRV